MYAHATSEEQDRFLLNFIVPYQSERKSRQKESARSRRISIQYLLRKADSRLVPICAASFTGITGIGNVIFDIFSKEWAVLLFSNLGVIF